MHEWPTQDAGERGSDTKMRALVAFGLCTFWLMLLWAYSASASGRLVATPTYSVQTSQMLLSGGLLIQEKLPLVPVVYSSLTGVSQEAHPGTVDTQWLSTRHEIDVAAWDNLSITPGITMSFAWPHDEWRNYLHMRLSYKIW